MAPCFLRNGYMVARSVVAAADLPALIDACRRLTASDDGWAAPASAVCRDPVAAGALFGPRALDAVEALLGPEPILLPSESRAIHFETHIRVIPVS